jgi:hypothetical protein
MVRVLVELHLTDAGSVEGTLTPEGNGGESQSFSGWLDLLRLLEAALAVRPDHGAEA